MVYEVDGEDEIAEKFEDMECVIYNDLLVGEVESGIIKTGLMDEDEGFDVNSGTFVDEDNGERQSFFSWIAGYFTRPRNNTVHPS